MSTRKGRSYIWLAALAGFAVSAMNGAAQVAVENSKTTYFSTATNVMTVANVAVGAGSNRKLVVVLNSESAIKGPTSITYGGTGLTNAADTGATRIAEIWYLDAPAVGTANLVLSWSGNARARVGVMSLQNASAGFDVAKAGYSATATNMTLTTTVSNAFVVGTFTQNDGADIGNPKPFATQLYNGDSGSSLGYAGYQVEEVPGLKSYSFVLTTTAPGYAGVAFGSEEAPPLPPTSPIIVASTKSYYAFGGPGALTTHTISNVVVNGTLGSKLAVAVAAEAGSGFSVNVTYGGTNLTEAANTENLGTANGNRYLSVWYLDDPAEGTNNVVVELSTAEDPGVQVIHMLNAKPGVSLGDEIYFGNAQRAYTNDVTTTESDTLLFGVVGINSTSGNSLPGRSWTTELSKGNSGSSYAWFGTRNVSLPGTISMTWSNTVAQPTAIALAGFAALEDPDNNSFDAWLAQYNVGSMTNLTDDFDLDGMDHLLEYALGGNPEINDAATVMPVALVDDSGASNLFAYVYNRWTDAGDRGLTYTVKRDTDLVFTTEGWTTSGIAETTGPAAVNGYETVTNTVPADVAARFMRLQVELAE